jgi:hypothetical protein
MITNGGGIATSRIRVNSYKLPRTWVHVRLRDVITPQLEVTDHAQEKQT